MKAIPLPWIERLIERFGIMYGAKFLDLWKNVDPAAMKRAWAEELSGFTAEELKRGLAICKTKPFPPTLPEFMNFCREGMNPETAFYEALEQMRLRNDGRDKWSHPAIYWTAVKIGEFDLRNQTWATLRARWTEAFRKTLEEGQWPDVPEKALTLPAPGHQTISKEEAAKRVAEIAQRTGLKPVGNDGHKRWAERIFDRYAAGEYTFEIGLAGAEEALGRKRPERPSA